MQSLVAISLSTQEPAASMARRGLRVPWRTSASFFVSAQTSRFFPRRRGSCGEAAPLPKAGEGGGVSGPVRQLLTGMQRSTLHVLALDELLYLAVRLQHLQGLMDSGQL